MESLRLRKSKSELAMSPTCTLAEIRFATARLTCREMLGQREVYLSGQGERRLLSVIKDVEVENGMVIEPDPELFGMIFLRRSLHPRAIETRYGIQLADYPGVENWAMRRMLPVVGLDEVTLTSLYSLRVDESVFAEYEYRRNGIRCLKVAEFLMDRYGGFSSESRQKTLRSLVNYWRDSNLLYAGWSRECYDSFA